MSEKGARVARRATDAVQKRHYLSGTAHAAQKRQYLSGPGDAAQKRNYLSGTAHGAPACRIPVPNYRRPYRSSRRITSSR